VCTNHIHWNPARDFVKYGQALNIHFNIAGFLVKNNLDQKDIPIIITGDFNSRPNSSVINLMYGNPFFKENYDLARVKD
jgi:predicted extracellular nuclease